LKKLLEEAQNKLNKNDGTNEVKNENNDLLKMLQNQKINDPFDPNNPNI